MVGTGVPTRQYQCLTSETGATASAVLSVANNCAQLFVTDNTADAVAPVSDVKH